MKNDLKLTTNTQNLTPSRSAVSMAANDIVNGTVSKNLSKLGGTPQFKETLNEKLSDKNSGSDATDVLPENEDLRKAFQDFVGQTLFSQMIASMRKTQEGAAYFNGGRAEKIFQGQLDQVLSEKLSEASASKISDPMFKLFQLQRRQ